MIRDITIGQYYNTKSVIHSLDPRMKLNAVMIFILSIFFVKSYIGYLISAIFLFFCIKLSNVPMKFILRGLKSILFLLFLSIFLNIFFTPGREIFSYKIFKITYEGLDIAGKMMIRLIILILFSTLLTLTTTPMQLTDGIDYNLSFLKIFKIPISDIALMMSIALRFIPILIEEVDKIMKAQISRGVRFDDKNFLKRIKAYIPILVPIFVSAFKRSNDLAIAMESRCYVDSDNRTKLNPLVYKKIDFFAYIYVFTYLIVIIFLYFLKPI